MDGYISVGCVCGCVHYVLASFPGSCAHASLGTRLIMYVYASVCVVHICMLVYACSPGIRLCAWIH